MKVVAVAETRLTQLVLALVLVDDRHIDLLQDVLVLAVVTEGVLTPSGSPAALAGEVGEFIGKTGRRDVRGVGEVDRLVHLQDGQIVVQRSSVVLWVHLHRDDVPFDVRIELDVVVDVPFTQADAQIEAVVAERYDRQLIRNCA